MRHTCGKDHIRNWILLHYSMLFRLQMVELMLSGDATVSLCLLILLYQQDTGCVSDVCRPTKVDQLQDAGRNILCPSEFYLWIWEFVPNISWVWIVNSTRNFCNCPRPKNIVLSLQTEGICGDRVLCRLATGIVINMRQKPFHFCICEHQNPNISHNSWFFLCNSK